MVKRKKRKKENRSTERKAELAEAPAGKTSRQCGADPTGGWPSSLGLLTQTNLVREKLGALY